MRPTFTPGYVPASACDALALILTAETPWANVDDAPRDECFMALDLSLTYSYGNDNQRRTRVYKAAPMHPAVDALMQRLNADYGAAYNVCVLNYYADERRHLGWHSDDSPELNPEHPIAVIAFGATRELWVKHRGATGLVPAEDRFAMTPGALFAMPPGFQDVMLHRIPKHPARCGPRVSLTFRKLDRAAPIPAP